MKSSNIPHLPSRSSETIVALYHKTKEVKFTNLRLTLKLGIPQSSATWALWSPTPIPSPHLFRENVRPSWA